MSWSSMLSLDSLALDDRAWDSFDINSITNTAGEANPSGLHSEAEIQSLVVDETLDPLARALHLFNSTQPIQRHSVVAQLPSIIDNNHALCDVLLPHLCRLWPELCDEELSSVVDSMEGWIERGVISETLCEKLLSPHCTKQLSVLDSNGQQTSSLSLALASDTDDSVTLSSQSPVVRLVSSIIKRYATTNAIIRTTLTTFVTNNADSIHSQARMVAALVSRELLLYVASIPSLAVSLRSFASSLCQDTSLDVRRSMSATLVAFAHYYHTNANTGSYENHADYQWLCSELNELLNDEEKSVKLASLNALCELLEIVHQDTAVDCLLPMVRTLLSAPSKHLHHAIAHMFGSIVYALRDVWHASDTRALHAFYKVTATNTESEMRFECAFNLPCLLTMAVNHSSSSSGLFDWNSYLFPLLVSFTNDNNPSVRACVANQLPVLLELLLSSQSTNKTTTIAALIKDTAIPLMKDSDRDARDKGVHSMKIIIERIGANLAATKPALLPPSLITELLKALLAVDSALTSSPLNGYRVKLDCIQALSLMQPIYASSSSSSSSFATSPYHEMTLNYFDRLTPTLFSHLHSAPPPPLLEEVVSILAQFTARVPFATKRNELISRIVREFGPTARSCYDRLVFLSFFHCWTKLASRRWLRKHCWPHLAKLAQNESVSSVKSKLCHCLVAMRQCLRTTHEPKDVELLTKLLTTLSTDNNQWVRETGKQCLAALTSTDGHCQRADETTEAEDKLREQLEEKLLADEEELNDALLKREQQRERSALLNSSSGSGMGLGLGASGSANSNAVALMIMKQKKEIKDREKERERERVREAQQTALQQAQLLASHSNHSSGDSNSEEKEEDVGGVVRRRRTMGTGTFSHIKPRIDTGSVSGNTARATPSPPTHSALLSPIAVTPTGTTVITTGAAVRKPTARLASPVSIASLTARSKMLDEKVDSLTDDDKTSTKTQRARLNTERGISVLPGLSSTKKGAPGSQPSTPSAPLVHPLSRRYPTPTLPASASSSSSSSISSMPAIVSASPRIKSHSQPITTPLPLPLQRR